MNERKCIIRTNESLSERVSHSRMNNFIRLFCKRGRSFPNERKCIIGTNESLSGTVYRGVYEALGTCTYGCGWMSASVYIRTNEHKCDIGMNESLIASVHRWMRVIGDMNVSHWRHESESLGTWMQVIGDMNASHWVHEFAYIHTHIYTCPRWMDHWVLCVQNLQRCYMTIYMFTYGVALVSMIEQMIGLLFKRAL